MEAGRSWSTHSTATRPCRLNRAPMIGASRGGVGSDRRRTRRGPSGAERPDDDEAAREAALKLLEHTRRTRSDLARRLREKGFSGPLIDEVLERLAGVGLVDDVEFARAWLAGRWGRRPAGWRRLQQQLRASGVSQEDSERARQ